MSDIQMINGYTPVAEFAGNVINGIYTVRFDNLQTNAHITAFWGVYNPGEKPYEIDAEFGACLKLVCDGDSTGDAVIEGYDYLGQPVVEEVTASGTTGVMTNKCFKYISSVVCAAGAAVVVTFTRKLILGVPYKTVKIFNETRNGALVTTTQLVQPVNTEATVSSGEPRGKLNLGTYATAANIKLILVADDYSDATIGGGLFGVPHFHA